MMRWQWPGARHVYLSPHLDDVVLSCGALLYQQAAHGEQVAVITVFAGDPPQNSAFSPFAASLHTRWTDSAALADIREPAEVRRAEDQNALRLLHPSIEVVHLDLVDCIYRRDPRTGEWLYASEEAIFGFVHPADSALDFLCSASPPAPDVQLYAPLGVGNHVDHQVLRQIADYWAQMDAQVAYYEEFPYSAQPGAVQTALVGSTGWQVSILTPDEESLAAKIRAVAQYTSQISTFWESPLEMAQALRLDAAQRGERLWRHC